MAQCRSRRTARKRLPTGGMLCRLPATATGLPVKPGSVRWSLLVVGPVLPRTREHRPAACHPQPERREVKPARRIACREIVPNRTYPPAVGRRTTALGGRRLGTMDHELQVVAAVSAHSGHALYPRQLKRPCATHAASLSSGLRSRTLRVPADQSA
jgi:hypothetical protein